MNSIHTSHSVTAFKSNILINTRVPPASPSVVIQHHLSAFDCPHTSLSPSVTAALQLSKLMSHLKVLSRTKSQSLWLSQDFVHIHFYFALQYSTHTCHLRPPLSPKPSILRGFRITALMPNFHYTCQKTYMQQRFVCSYNQYAGEKPTAHTHKFTSVQ
jgi:hypothetical protein